MAYYRYLYHVRDHKAADICVAVDVECIQPLDLLLHSVGVVLPHIFICQVTVPNIRIMQYTRRLLKVKD
jgi:hypothetical protein